MKVPALLRLEVVLLIFAVVFAAPLAAQDSSDVGAQANNPLASTKTVNFQNQYNGNLTGVDEPGNTFYLRGAMPVSIGESNWLLRATLPFNSLPTGPSGKQVSGLGDFNIFAAYLIDVGNPKISFGVGPQVTAPTAVNGMGSGKWSLGLANVLFDARNSKFQWGYLLTWQASVAGDKNRSDVNFGAFQPFGMYQLGDGWYLRSTGVWTYDFETDNYAVPIGFGIGKVTIKPNVVINTYVEPQYTVASRGAFQAEWGVFVGINFQFK